MNIVDRAKELRVQIELNAEVMSDEESLDYKELFPNWKINTAYEVGYRVRYNGPLYKCVQAHTSQDDWTPDVTPALWVNVAEPQDEWPEWVQPTGSQDAYMKGDKVTYHEEHYISTTDNNVWAPDVYGWEKA